MEAPQNDPATSLLGRLLGSLNIFPNLFYRDPSILTFFKGPYRPTKFGETRGF